MKPIFSARTRSSSWEEMPATFCPSSQTSPALGRSRQPIRFTSVDLPDPDGPMIDNHSPGTTRRAISARARITPLPLVALPFPLPISAAQAGQNLGTLLTRITSLSAKDDDWLYPPPRRQGHDGRT